MTLPAGDPRAQAADAVAALMRGVRFHRLYPAVHPFCVEAVDEARDALETYHELHGDLLLELRRDGVYLDDALLGGKEGLPLQLARLLYPEGARALTVAQGLDREQLARFVLALAGGWEEDAGEGLLANLGRLDLPNLHFQVHDELAPARLGRECHDPTLAPVLGRIAELMTALAPETADGLALDALLERATAPLTEPAGLSSFPEWSALYMDSEPGAPRRRLAEELAQDSIPLRVGQMTCAALRAPPAARPHADDAVATLADCVLGVLERGHIEDALGLARRVPPDLLGPLRGRLARPEGLAALVRACRTADLTGPPREAALGFLRLLGAEGMPAVCRLVASPRLEGEPGRALLLEHVQRGAAEATPGALRPLLDAASEETVRLAMDLLMRAGRGSPGWKQVEELSADPRHARAALARQLLAERSGSRRRNELMRTIREGSLAQARLDAWAALRALPEPSAAWEEVVAWIQGNAFLDRSEDEQRLALDVLVALDPRQARAVLDELGSRQSLLRRRQQGQLSVLALQRLRQLMREGGGA